ncbi:MAG TPA: adenine phosphoribosyltransferase [Actinomycetales bacterium]|nr:adenine phosphoribosyltransferase [Actinomycetales bacterium]
MKPTEDNRINSGEVQLIIERVRQIPDYPQPGVIFKDITPVLADGAAFAALINQLAAVAVDTIDVVVGIEARGFILGAPVARALNAGFVPVRKAGKLPHETIAQAYDLEYGSATIEIHSDAVRAGDRVLVVDDVLATGGTARATCQLLEKLGATVVTVAMMLEIYALAGRKQLADYDLVSLIIDD